MEKLDFLVRFWELRARFETLGVPLTKSEGFELLSLLQFLTANDEPNAIESIDASRQNIPTQLTTNSGFLATKLKDLSTERLMINAIEALPNGQRTILYITDAVSGVEY